MSAPVQYPAIKVGGAGQWNGPDTDGSIQVQQLRVVRDGDGAIYVQNGDSMPYSRLGNKLVALVPVAIEGGGSNQHNAEVEYDGDTGIYTFRTGLPGQWQEQTLAGGTGYDVYTDEPTTPGGTVTGRFNFNGWRTPVSGFQFSTPGGKFLVQRGEATLDRNQSPATQGGIIPVRDFTTTQSYNLRFTWVDVFHRFEFTFDGEAYQATVADPWPVTVDSEPMTPGGLLWGTFDLAPYSQTGEQFLVMAPDSRTTRTITEAYLSSLSGVDQSADYTWTGRQVFRGVKPQIEVGELTTTYAGLSADAGDNGRLWFWTGTDFNQLAERLVVSASGLQVLPQVVTIGPSAAYGSIRSPGTSGPMKLQNVDGIQLDQAADDINAVQLIVTAAGTVEVRDPAGSVDNGILKAGTLEFTQAVKATVPISFPTNQKVIDVLKDDGAMQLFLMYERDGGIWSMGTSRGLAFYRDASGVGSVYITGSDEIALYAFDNKNAGVYGRGKNNSTQSMVNLACYQPPTDPELTPVLLVGTGQTAGQVYAARELAVHYHDRTEFYYGMRAPNLPTNPAGLVAGDFWNNAGVVNVATGGAQAVGEFVNLVPNGTTDITLPIPPTERFEATLDITATTADINITLDMGETDGGRSGLLVLKLPNPAKDVNWFCTQGPVKVMGNAPQWHQLDGEHVLASWRFTGSTLYLLFITED